MNGTSRKEIPALVLLGGWFVAVAILWQKVPDRLPVHMGHTGEIDAYGGKFVGLLLLPLVSLALYVFMFYITRWDKSFQTGRNRVGAYPITRLATVLVVMITQLLLSTRELYPDLGLAAALPGLIGAFFVLIGNYLGKTRPSRFFGVRTPWTFKSKLSWVGSNRVGGWLMVSEGLALIFLSFLWPQIWFRFFLVSTWALVIAVLAYSYHLFRVDPDPVPPFGVATVNRK